MISLFMPQRRAEVEDDGYVTGSTRGPVVSVVGNKTAAGVRVTEETALNVSAVFACTRALSQTLAMLPAILYRALDDSERERATDSPLYRLLKTAPNPEMDSMTFWEMMAAWNVNLGNAFAEKEVNGRGDILALWPIHPSRIIVDRDDNGVLFYRVRNGRGRPDTRLAADKMLNIVGALSSDGITAKGVIGHALQSIGAAAATVQYAASFWGNDARPGVIITQSEDPLEDSERDTFRRDWVEMHQGPMKARKPAVMPRGMDVKELGVTNEQAQLIQSMQFSVEDLARWYGVPPHVIGHLLHATIANVEQEQIGWRQRGILPLAVRFEKAINRQLLPADGTLYCEWLLDMIERADTKTRAEATKLEIESGQLTPNEGRRRENKPRYEEGGDKPLFPMNFTTLDRIESGESLKNTASQSPKGPQAEAVAPEVNLLAALNETLLRLAAPKETKTDDAQAKQLAANTAKQWLDDSWLRMIRREKKQAEAHAVDAKKFCSWLDSYGEQHAALLVETIQTPVSAWLSAMSDPREPLAVATSLATQHVTTSHDLLLTACECSAESLSSSVSACVATWETRTVSLDQLQGT